MAIHPSDMVEILSSDLANEYKHWHFYINAAMRVQGLHREQIRQWLIGEAQSEAIHIQQFGDLIIGLGGVPGAKVNGFRTDLTDAKQILEYACAMEQEVVKNYVERKAQAEGIGGIMGSRISIFLDGQIQQSAEDADHLKQMIAGL